MAWVSGVASLASGIYNAYQQNQQANEKAAMTAEQLQQEFQNQIYRDQMQRAYTLQDRNAKINAINRFNGATTENAKDFVPGSVPMAAGQTTQLFDTSNLDRFDPSIVGDGSSNNPNSLIGYMKAHPYG